MRVAVRLTSGEELVGTIIEKFEDGIWLKRCVWHLPLESLSEKGVC